MNIDQERPLSPHIQIYRWQITSLTSAAHRLTGLSLIAALHGWIVFLGAWAYDRALLSSILDGQNTWFGRFLITWMTWSFFYHVVYNIRHIFWDHGHLMTRKSIRLTSGLIWTIPTLLTLIMIGIFL